MRNSTTKYISLLLVLLCVAFSVTAIAQETTGGVQGTVKDQNGAVVVGATVEVSGSALIGTRSATTDSGGSFRITQLPPGSYNIVVSSKGFTPLKQQGLMIQTGSLPTVNFTMKLGTSTVMEVTAETPQVDVTQSEVRANVTQEILTAIPKGRSFQSVIPFAAGARQEPMQGGTGSRTNGFQIDGASDGENVYMIDGINTTQIQNGGVGKNFQSDFIQEVQVKSSSFEAEYGGALGGVINAVPKRGSNAWHGELKMYYQSASLDANDICATGYTSGGSTVCGLRLDPTKAGLSSGARLDGTPQYYIPIKDSRHTIEPGYEIGGPIFKDRLWLFSSFIPSLDTTQRTTQFTGANAGPRRLSGTVNQMNAYNRLDYRAFDKLRLYASWNYAYSRSQGTLGASDSATGLFNSTLDLIPGGSRTDPNTLRADAGTVAPLSVWTFGGDWTPNSKTVVSSKYGYFYNNAETRGTPIGVRDVYDTTLSATTLDVTGAVIPNTGGIYQSAGFANIPSNVAQLYNPLSRKSWNTDVSYFVGNFFGSHTFKAGYMWSNQFNKVLVSANTAVVDFAWGTAYTPVTSTTACNAVKATNAAGLCQGLYGYFYVGGNATSQTGSSKAVDQALYFQDSWSVGHSGLTINAGIRFDSESNPAYDPTRFPNINFGWGDKIAPRIGASYDLLHNGKVKVYGSYGQFYDIMKLGLTRGSFGSDYWHQCVYALNTLNIASIVPTLGSGAGCGPSGPAPGVTAAQGTFIENVDFRATKNSTIDPPIQAGMKPVKTHEIVGGVDWAINPTWSLETRYSSKRLDNTIEDMSITDNLGFYVGNPGSVFGDLLHRPVDLLGNNVLTPVAFCAECPAVVKASRRYDGLEVSLIKAYKSNWYGKVTYTYSKLRGNYSGLTDTDSTDGGGGRHSPNNGRAFDLPTMTYLPSGKIDDGPLATDRPQTAKAFGYYRLHWLGQETWLGFTQSAFQGSPLSTCMPVVGTSSACQWAEGRGNFVNFTRNAATGDFVASSITQNARTAPFFQSDFNLRQVFKVHEKYSLVLQANAYNLLNQHSVVAVNEIAVAGSGLISPTRASRFAGDPQVDWNKVMTAYNYVDAVNGAGAFSGAAAQAKLTLASRYSLPTVFQTARQFRFEIHFIF